MAVYTLKGKNARIERDAFRALSTAFGVQPTAIGHVLTLKGRTFTLDGINPDFATRPFIVKRDDGKRFPVGVATVREQVGPEYLTRRNRALRVELGVHNLSGF